MSDRLLGRLISALSEMHQARKDWKARVPGYARRMRNARRRVRYWEKICAAVKS